MSSDNQHAGGRIEAQNPAAGRQKNGGRIEWLDLEKGFAMLLVLVGHSMRDEMRVDLRALDLVYRMVYIFHMTCFFWLSGYTWRLSRDAGKAPQKVFSGRIRKQFVPWILYTLAIWVIFSAAASLPASAGILAGAGYRFMPLPEYLLRALQANNPFAYHLWFLYVLMLLSALVAFADTLTRGRHLKEVAIALFLAGTAGMAAREMFSTGEWWRLYDYITLYLPVYCLGILMKDLKVSKSVCRVWGIAGLAYIVIRAVFFSGFSGNSVQAGSAAGRFAIYLLADLLLPGVILMLAELFDSGKLPFTGAGRRFLLYTGRESMLIYLLHQPFCCAFAGMVLYSHLGLSALPVMALCFLASLALPFIAVRAISFLRKR